MIKQHASYDRLIAFACLRVTFSLYREFSFQLISSWQINRTFVSIFEIERKRREDLMRKKGEKEEKIKG